MNPSSNRSYDLLWLSLALLVLLPIAFFLSITPHDYWYYVRLGKDIMESGAIPAVDTLSYTYAGTPTPYQPWLAEILFWDAYSLGGATLTFLLRGICIGTAYAVLWLSIHDAGAGTKLATFITILLGLSSSTNWSIRPQMFAYPLFAVALWALWHWQNGSGKKLWLIPTALALWVNLHGSFVLAFLLLGSALLFGAGDRKQLGIWSGISVLATFINPHGIFIWSSVLDVFNSSSVQAYAAEWHPPANAGWQMNIFFGWLLLFIPLTATSPRRLSLLEWVWFLGFGWLALTGVRYVIWFIFIMAILSGGLLGRLMERFQLDTDPQRSNPTINYLLSVFILLLPLGMLPGIREVWWKDSPPAYHEPTTAMRAAEWLAEHPNLPGPLFAEYTFSSYLTFALPSRPVWIDNRFHIYPEEHWQDYQTISAARSGWDDLLNKDRINLLMLSQLSQPALIEAVEKSGEWCEQYRDNYAMIFSRCEPIP